MFCQVVGREALELAEELSGDVALQAALDLADALAFGEAALHVALGGRVLAHADEHDGVQGAVELAVTAAVQAMTDDGARGRFDRCDAGEPGEGRLGAHPAAMRPRGDDLTGDDRADADAGRAATGRPGERGRRAASRARRLRSGRRAPAGRWRASPSSWRTPRWSGWPTRATQRRWRAARRAATPAAAHGDGRGRWSPTRAALQIARVRNSMAWARVVSRTRIASRSPRQRGSLSPIAGQRLAGGSHGVDVVALGAGSASRALRAVDLDHWFAVAQQRRGQPGAERCRCPRPPTADDRRGAARRRSAGDSRPGRPGRSGDRSPRPSGCSAAAVWVCLWVSTPMTTSSSSASMVFAPLPKGVAVGAGPSDVVAGL